ncbi:hypothetical protein [Aliikangiella sp. IMCC44359]|uniref:hypothetical protein n=1 Tax=Aliikangiella sp. IMCC44359 TaxID=3459125 RepID=UPI00403AC4F7
MFQKFTLPTALFFLIGIYWFLPLVNAQSTPTKMKSYQSKTVQCPISDKQPNTFALCATATCWTLDGVAYCKCDVMNEKSISISFDYEENGQSKNVCNLLLDGNNNGFTVSTYATPRQIETDYNPKIEKLGPPMGYYTCPTLSGSQAYGAQCDGGICFQSTQGQYFPGLGHIKRGEIVCSCPPTLSSSPGFQIAGPWNCEPGDTNENNQCCDKSYYDQMCFVTNVKSTGTKLAVSAPIGGAKAFSILLDGKPPSLNTCY